MGKNSGNNYAKATSGTIAVNSNGRKMTAAQMSKIKATAESIDNLEHREVVKQLNRAISRYEKVMGVREKNIKVAEMSGAYGATFIGSDGSHGIYLNKSIFNKHRNAIESSYRKHNYETGLRTPPIDQYNIPLLMNSLMPHGLHHTAAQDIELLEKKSQSYTEDGKKIPRRKGTEHTENLMLMNFGLKW